MTLRFAPFTLALALSACGGRSDLLSTGALGQPGKLTLVVVLVDDLFLPGDEFTSARVVVRSQGFDILGVTAGAPFSIVARRAAVATDPLALDFAGPPSPIIGDTLNGFEATASGDLLAICHNHADADPILFSSFTGMYAGQAATTLFAGGSICDGIALHGDQGLVAVHKLPPDGKCCSRPSLASISAGGTVKGPEATALPDGEFADVSLARYGNGYVSAGFVQAPAVFVRFAPDGGSVASTPIAVTAQSDTRPRLAAWPFDATQAAVAFLDGPSEARIVVVGETGTTVHTETIAQPAPDRMTRPSVAAVTDGLLDAFASCPADMGRGSITIELRGADGAVIASSAMLPGECPAGVDLAAAFDDIALFAWAKQGGGYRGALVQVTRE
jgi:hypothetical protein